ncbi:MAG: AraC family transcriptional regulator [Rhodobacterales bacterium]|nr:MAG: AraC family transcriptional regulator [Rhodobacterales bacterium]
MTTAEPQTPQAEREFAFLLLPGFSLLGFAGAVEVLRLSNAHLGRAAYGWRRVALEGDTAQAACGTCVAVDAALNHTRPGALDTVVYCGDAPDQTALQDRLPDIAADISQSGATIYTIGRSGAIDLMLNRVARDHGAEVAGAVAAQVFPPPEPEPPSIKDSYPPKLAAVITRMEASLAAPESPARLAAEAGLSVRQLERLFRRYLDRSPKRYYMELRLQQAHHLLTQSDMPVAEVAHACGFVSPSHFSKCYRTYFQTTPYRERVGPGAK